MLITINTFLFGGGELSLYLCSMKIIKLTSHYDGSDVYLNVDYIGHFYRGDNFTAVGLTTHNNGGFKVKETPQEILDLIKI